MSMPWAIAGLCEAMTASSMQRDRVASSICAALSGAMFSSDALGAPPWSQTRAVGGSGSPITCSCVRALGLRPRLPRYFSRLMTFFGTAFCALDMLVTHAFYGCRGSFHDCLLVFLVSRPATVGNIATFHGG